MDRAHPSQDIQTASAADLTPALGADFPLRVELLLDDSAPDPSRPFMVLSDYGGHGRVYAARVHFGHRMADRLVAIKTQAPPPGDDTAGWAATHQARERRWLREVDHYAAVQSVARGFTPVFFTETIQDEAGVAERPRTWPPLIYCRERRVLFPPLAPSGSPLVTCRQDDLLTVQGLPPYSGSTCGFLYNAEDLARGRRPVFYQSSPCAEQANPNAGTLEQLLDDMAAMDGMPGRPAPNLEKPEAIEAFARVVRALPCMTCPLRDECYPDGAFRERLVWFLTEDTGALALELNRFRYDEYCDVLGGMGWPEFDARYLGPKAPAERRLRLGEVEALLEPGGRALLGADETGLDALEIFRLKWNLFCQLSQALYDFHRLSRAAHLKVSPEHVMVQIGAIGPGLPAVWQSEARLISLGAPALQIAPTEGVAEEILLPPEHTNPLYRHPILAQGDFGNMQTGALTVAALEPADGEGRFVMVVDLEAEGLSLAPPSLKDQVRIVLKGLRGLGDRTFYAQRDPAAEPGDGPLRLRSHPVQVSEVETDAMWDLVGEKVPQVGFVIYRLFHVPCDIYSLGLLLFRTLLVNDGQSMEVVVRGLRRLRRLVEDRGEFTIGEGDEAVVWRELLDALEDEELAGRFTPSQVMYDAIDRGAERPNAIPRDVWDEALLLGLQLIGSARGLAVCTRYDDFDLRYPAGKMETVIRRTREIQARIDGALFARDRHNAELRAALDAILAETPPPSAG